MSQGQSILIADPANQMIAPIGFSTGIPIQDGFGHDPVTFLIDGSFEGSFVPDMARIPFDNSFYTLDRFASNPTLNLVAGEGRIQLAFLFGSLGGAISGTGNQFDYSVLFAGGPPPAPGDPAPIDRIALL